MTNYSISYTLYKDGKELNFVSEKNACDFLGVSRCSVASCFRRGAKCKGYDIYRGSLTTHGATKTRLFKIWEGMKERCYRAKHPHYKDYGGRGIEICKSWMDFLTFRDWALSSGYSENLTIDRVDVNGNYEPGNCRWIPLSEQAKNTRRNHYVTVNGETMILSECSQKYGIPKSTLRWRETHNRDLISGAKMDDEPPKEEDNDNH